MSVMNTFKPFTAPYRFVFVDPDTGRQFHARNKKELFTQVVDYRAQNNLEPLEELNVVIENYLCGLPENIGNCEPFKLKRGFMSFLSGGIALVKNMYYGDERMVSQEVAEKRAGICVHPFPNSDAACPYNIFPDKDLFVEWSDEVAEAATRGRKTELHNELGNCEVCTCTLKAKVFQGGEIELPPDQDATVPDFCWQKRINQ